MAKFLKFNNNHEMPIFGLGTFQNTDEKELEVALDTALEVGYRHIDTAAAFDNEHIIGKVLNKWFLSKKIKRDEIFLSTKLPLYATHPDRVENALKTSLEKLKIDYIDLYLIQFPFGGKLIKKDGKPYVEPENENNFAATWKKMEEQVDKRRAKSIGLSNCAISQIDRILKNSRIKPVCLQTEISLYLQQRNVVNYCEKNGLVLIGYGSLGSSGYFDSMKKSGIICNDKCDGIMNDPMILNLSEKYKKTPAQIILRYLVQNNIVVIPKSANPKRIRENFEIWDFELEETDIKMIIKLNRGPKARIYEYKNILPQFLGHLEFTYFSTCNF